MNPQDMLSQMLQSQPQAAQQAAPSAAQPGGGSQMVQGLTPQQQSVLADFNMFIAKGKQICAQLDQMGSQKEAAELDMALGKITMKMIGLKEEFAQDALETSLAGQSGGVPQQMR